MYVVGESGLEAELDAVGIQHIGGTVGNSAIIIGRGLKGYRMKDPEDKVFMTVEELGQLVPDPSVGAVLCGFDANISTITSSV